MTTPTPDPLLPATALSVGDLTSYIKYLLETDRLLRFVWVVGEVSSLNLHRNGHLYFTLQDAQAGATLNCTIWKSQLPRLTHRPQTEKQILAGGQIQLYPPQGKYQLIVNQVLPAGDGLQALRRQQLKNRLQAEGLFDPQRKRPLPPHPQIIAVVTSPTGAAWGDIRLTLQQRYPGLRVLLSPAIVQGHRAPDSIVAAIEKVQQDGRAEVLILSRGGGAVEDLACFNHERVVRAVASCSIPVITGIGHERDESLTDLVADFCAHTPTAIAEAAVPQLSQLYTAHRQRRETLQRLLDQKCQIERHRLQYLQQQLIGQTSQRFTQATSHCQQLRHQLAALDPRAVLKRGYAVLRRSDSSLVRTAGDLAIGDKLLVDLAEGRLQVQITQVLPPDTNSDTVSNFIDKDY